MEYTKDIILHVNYGQDVRTKRSIGRVFCKFGEILTKHKMMTTIISITIMLIFLDFMLVTSFIQILSSI